MFLKIKNILVLFLKFTCSHLNKKTSDDKRNLEDRFHELEEEFHF